jgi:acetyl esterase/lipase
MRRFAKFDLVTCALVLLGFALETEKTLSAAGPEPELLWPDGAPGAVGTEDQDKPEIRAYLPPRAQATGAGVVICPGGGYAVLATDHEGHQVAKWFNSIGVTAFVLKYRLGRRYKHPAPLHDAQRALRYVRANADRFGIAPHRVGIMGFSAGGHLASTAATHFDAGQPDSRDPIERMSCRPDFAILAYPVISLTADFSHRGSGANLFGENPDPKLLESLSNEKQVTPETPPTFLFHTAEDTGVPVENSLAFFAALRKAKVPAELHVYQFGPHGVGLAPGDPALSGWKTRLADWLRTSGFLADFERAAVQGTVTVNGKPLRWGQIVLIPARSSNLPVAFGMINQGKFQVAAARGPAVGENRIEIHNLGSVEPRPTIEDAELLNKSSSDAAEMLHADIKPEQNQLHLDIKSTLP